MRRSRRHEEELQQTIEPAPAPVKRQESDLVRRLADLQRLAGNQAVVAATQASSALHVGHADDACEHAADRAADRALERLEAADATTVHRSASAGPGTASGAEVGREGGPVQPQTAAQIESARSSGRSMDPEVRRSMETAFDADFSGVRIHADNRAADLNQRLSARAFTTGRDVFFGKGEYSPGTSSGRRVLAHELAHTLQQGSGVGRVHRLAFQNTNWGAVNSAKVSKGGGMGVLIVDDGSGPLVVKAGEDMGAEAAVAAKLLSEAVGGGGTGWSASAPEARPVEAAEAQKIHAAAQSLVGTTKREQNLMSDLAAAKGVMVFGFAKGEELQDSMTNNAQTKKGLFGSSVRKGTASYALMNDPGLLQTLGRASASDVILGNGDRIVGSTNFENVMLDLNAKTLSLIDNVQMKMETFLRDAKHLQTDAKDSYDAWTQHERVKKLAGGSYKEIADQAIDGVGDKMWQLVAKEEKQVIRTAFTSKKAKMTVWFMKGLQEGNKNCLAALNSALKLVSTLPADQQQEVAANIIARRNFIQGMGAKPAWDAAEKEAERLFAPKTAPSTTSAPPTQQQTTPWKKATPKPQWKSAQPKGRWKPATPGSWG